MSPSSKIKKYVEKYGQPLDAAIVCLSCYGAFEQAVNKDSCEKCGHRYNPEVEGEHCPACGDDNYICHCPGCDAQDPAYFVDVADDFNEYFESEHPYRDEVLNNMYAFLRERDATEQAFAADPNDAGEN